MCPKETLLCTETMLDETAKNIETEQYFGVKSVLDKIILKDERVIQNMIAEEKHFVRLDYCANLQTEIKPHMRKIVVDWMLEVCEDQQCQPQVYHLAVNYLDRFLSKRMIKKPQFQFLATVNIIYNFLLNFEIFEKFNLLNIILFLISGLLVCSFQNVRSCSNVCRKIDNFHRQLLILYRTPILGTPSPADPGLGVDPLHPLLLP